MFNKFTNKIKGKYKGFYLFFKNLTGLYIRLIFIEFVVSGVIFKITNLFSNRYNHEFQFIEFISLTPGTGASVVVP